MERLVWEAAKEGYIVRVQRCPGTKPPAWWPEELWPYYVQAHQGHTPFANWGHHFPPPPPNLTEDQMREDYFVAWIIPRTTADMHYVPAVAGGVTEARALAALSSAYLGNE